MTLCSLTHMGVKVRTVKRDKPKVKMAHIPSSPCQRAEVLTQSGSHPSLVLW